MPKEISRVLVAYSDISVGEDANSRKVFNKIEELAASIKENGLIQPLVVREGGPSKEGGKRKYYLIAGERRYRAIGLLREQEPGKWNQVEVKLIKGSAEDTSILNLIENLQREDLEPLEEAQAMSDYMEKYKVSQAQLAERIGKSEPFISQRLTLLRNTPQEVKDALALPESDPNHITPTAVREIVTLPKEQQVEILHAVQQKQKAMKDKAPANGKSKKVSVPVAEVKGEADKRKAALGIKREKAARKSNGQSYDMEKVRAAREIFEGTFRPKTAVHEMAGTLLARLDNPNISEDTKKETKAKLKTIEWIFGKSDRL